MESMKRVNCAWHLDRHLIFGKDKKTEYLPKTQHIYPSEHTGLAIQSNLLLRQDWFYNFPRHIGQAIAATLKLESKLLVVDAHQV